MADNSARQHYDRAWIHSGILRMNGWKSSRVKHTLHQFWLGLSHPFINLKIISSHKNPAHCGFNIYVLCFLNTVCSYSVRCMIVKLLNTDYDKKSAHLCWYYCIQDVPHCFYGFLWRGGAPVFSAAEAGARGTGLTESRLLVWLPSKHHESVLWNMRHS